MYKKGLSALLKNKLVSVLKRVYQTKPYLLLNKLISFAHLFMFGLV